MRRAQQHRARRTREPWIWQQQKAAQASHSGGAGAIQRAANVEVGAVGERLLGRKVLVSATQRIHGPLGTGATKKIMIFGGGVGGSSSSSGHGSGGSSGQGQSA